MNTQNDIVNFFGTKTGQRLLESLHGIHQELKHITDLMERIYKDAQESSICTDEDAFR